MVLQFRINLIKLQLISYSLHLTCGSSLTHSSCFSQNMFVGYVSGIYELN